jgi:hypothetical protein
MEQENAFAKPNFPPFIMYVYTQSAYSIAYMQGWAKLVLVALERYSVALSV